MQYLKLFTFAILLSAIGISSLQAQDINQERMQRDINIMESILQEIFKKDWKTQDGALRIRGFNDTGTIQGIHLDDYGVIFTIPFEQSNLMIFQNATNADTDGTNTSSNTEITKDEIINRISDFLMNYGSTIGQLNNDDKITVIYATKNGNDSSFLQVISSNSKVVNKESLPTISITAEYSDLKAYRNGSINESTLQNRFNISIDNETEPGQRDLKIMANILKTSFEESEVGSFEVNGKVNHIYLDDLGGLFMMEASYNEGLFGIVTALRDKFAGSITIDSLRMESDSDGQDSRERLKKLQERRVESYQNFKTLLKETIIDYGRTLNSIPGNENILVSVSLSRTGNELPERIDMQVQKSVLQEMDRGNMSREQAMEQINVREY